MTAAFVLSPFSQMDFQLPKSQATIGFPHYCCQTHHVMMSTIRKLSQPFCGVDKFKFRFNDIGFQKLWLTLFIGFLNKNTHWGKMSPAYMIYAFALCVLIFGISYYISAKFKSNCGNGGIWNENPFILRTPIPILQWVMVCLIFSGLLGLIYSLILHFALSLYGFTLISIGISIYSALLISIERTNP